MKKRITLFVFTAIISLCFGKPVNSSIGATHSQYVQDSEPFANPYVVNGLIAMWDGQWNGRNGKHDPNGGLIEILSGTPTYLKTGSYVIADDCIKCTAASIASTPIPAIANLSTGQLTIEAVVSESSGRCIFFERPRPFECDSDEHAGNQIFYGNAEYSMICNAFVKPSLSSSWYTGFIRDKRVHRALTVSDTTVQWWIDAIGNSSAQKTCSPIGTSNDFTVWGWNWTYSFQATGEFCCLRIYNRALTAEEIAFNYAIDKERFGL